jgi:hypothetical protein
MPPSGYGMRFRWVGEGMDTSALVTQNGRNVSLAEGSLGWARSRCCWWWARDDCFALSGLTVNGSALSLCMGGAPAPSSSGPRAAADVWRLREPCVRALAACLMHCDEVAVVGGGVCAMHTCQSLQVGDEA